MTIQFRTVGLVSRPNSPDLVEPLLRLADGLTAAGYQIVIDANGLSGREVDFATGSRQDVVEAADVLVALGGDGTMLTLGRDAAPHRRPIVGVNQGRLGFMTDIPIESMTEGVLEVLAGRCHAESRLLLQATVYRGRETVFSSLALNDVVFSRGQRGSMIEFEIFVNKQFVYSQRSDGLIIATPTGSTAYALASGGPILHPTINAITLVPICPQSMSNRPIVINETCAVDCLLTRGGETLLHFDGHENCMLEELDRVVIHRYKHPLTILHPLSYNYYDTLRHKLHWGERLL